MNDIQNKNIAVNQAENQQVEKPTTSSEIEVVSKQKLMEAGAYFGRRASLWNPKMEQYIKEKKGGRHHIDVLKTQKMLEIAYKLIYKFAQKGATFMFVGTKKQAKKVILEQAIRTNSIYVSDRWLGGTLTNSRTILSRLKTMEQLEKLAENNFEGYTKKEGLLKQKELQKLQKNLNGIRKLKETKFETLIMLVADPNKDIIAVQEAKKKEVKIIGVVNTNTDPGLVDFPIPANDGSIKTLTLIFTILADAISAAKGGKQLFAFQPESQVILPEDPDRELKQTKYVRRFSSNGEQQENKVTETEVASN